MSYSALDMDGYVIQSLLVAIGHLYLRTVLVLPVQAFFLWCAAKDTSGGYCGGVPPLPIPNREVKPTCADGTAMQCGRVGSRLLYSRSPEDIMSPGLLFCIGPFSKSPPYAFQETVFLSRPIY